MPPKRRSKKAAPAPPKRVAAASKTVKRKPSIAAAKKNASAKTTAATKTTAAARKNARSAASASTPAAGAGRASKPAAKQSAAVRGKRSASSAAATATKTTTTTSRGRRPSVAGKSAPPAKKKSGSASAKQAVASRRGSTAAKAKKGAAASRAAASADVADDSEDSVVHVSSSSTSEVDGESVTPPVSSTAAHPGSLSSSSSMFDGSITVLPCMTPPRRQRQRLSTSRSREGSADEGRERRSGETKDKQRDASDDSPVVITADSESKRSSHRWRQQLLRSGSGSGACDGSLSATQLLRDDDEDDTEERAQCFVDASDREGTLPPEEQNNDEDRNKDEEENMVSADEAVKQLFARAPHSISYSRSDSSVSSLDRTLPMQETSNANEEYKRREENEEDCTSAYRSTPAVTSASGVKDKTAFRAHSLGGASVKDGDSLVLDGPPPPLSPTADTPPPPPSLFLSQRGSSSVTLGQRQRQQQQQQGLPSSSPSTGTAALGSWNEAVALGQCRGSEDGDDAFLRGATTFSNLHMQSTASSCSSWPALRQPDRTTPEVEAVSSILVRHGQQQHQPHSEGDKAAVSTGHAPHHHPHFASDTRTDASPSPQPKWVPGSTVTLSHAGHSAAGSASLSTFSESQVPLPQQQQQQLYRYYAPSSSSYHRPSSPSTTPVGHLRMGNASLGRARSPSASTSPARRSSGWLKKVHAEGQDGGATAASVVTASEQQQQRESNTTGGVGASGRAVWHNPVSGTHTALAASPGFPTVPLPLHEAQRQADAPAHPSLSARSTPPSWLPGVLETDAEHSVTTTSNNNSRRSSRSPLRLRPAREPPVWRSPQPAQFPTSLNVSARSAWAAHPATSTTTTRTDTVPAKRQADDGVAVVVKSEREGSFGLAPCELPTQLFHSAVSLPTSVVPGQRTRSLSSASSSSSSFASISTTVLTQTFTQASTDAGSAQGSGATQRIASSRPSTQLITQAAASRPAASPATMWICLDDDDDDEDGDYEEAEEEDEVEVVSDGDEEATSSVDMHHGGTVASLHMQRESPALGKKTREGRSTSRGREGSSDVCAADRPQASDATDVQWTSAARADGTRVKEPRVPSRKSSPARRRPAAKSDPIAEILSPTFRPRRRPTEQFTSRTRTDDGEDDEKTGLGDSAVTPRLCDTRGYFIRLDDSSEEKDDDDDEVEEEEEEGDSDVPPQKKARLQLDPPPRLPSLSAVVSTAPGSPETSLHSHEGTRDAAPHSPTGAVGVASLLTASDAPLIIDDDDDDSDDTHERDAENDGGRHDGMRADESASDKSSSSELRSPLKPTLTDLFFPQRLDPEVRPHSPLYESIHAYQQQYQEEREQLRKKNKKTTRSDAVDRTLRDSASANTAEALQRSGKAASAAISTTSTSAAAAAASTSASPSHHGATGAQANRTDVAAKGTAMGRSDGQTTAATTEGRRGDSPGHKRTRAEASSSSNNDNNNKSTISKVVVPALPDWGRPADTLLRDFFPTKFTKKSFMDAAQKVLSPMHFLEPADFWQAFTSAEFVGEGSFGLVWRCRTVTGDLVAVKSCPIILRTKANIEDSFSTIREIATMRFLNEMQVPYVLPLHSAFFVQASEALPPLAQEALQWRQQQRKKAEAVVLAEDVQRLGRRGGHSTHTNARQQQQKKKKQKQGGRGGGKKGSATTTVVEEEEETIPLTFEQRVAAELLRQCDGETASERATRARLQPVRLPRFFSITEDDLRQSDATAFLVMELCDGDVEGIPRSEGVAKGVVYCVSSALAAMHELGLLHLDLKPSNVLFAYEHGPSQRSLSSVSVPTAKGGPGSTATTATAIGEPGRMHAVKFYLSDFGNCRLVGPEKLDAIEDAYGTYEYMDLRALQDAVCGRPTDAFSLGATLYELLYGKRLYPKCQNPKCTEDDDHSRACFVEAAKRAVVLPAAPSLAASVGVGSPGKVAAIAGSPASGKHGAERRQLVTKAAGSAVANAAASLTPLQHLTLALLQRRWAERMTAAECRRFLIDAFNITQADDDGGEEAGDAERGGEEEK